MVKFVSAVEPSVLVARPQIPNGSVVDLIRWMAEAGHVAARDAGRLGLSRTTLYARIRQLRIEGY